MELTNEQLQKIIVHPKVLEFNRVFVKSTKQLNFAVKNELRTSIIVRLIIDQNTPDELSGTSAQTQIIPSSQVGAFDIQFSSPIFKHF